MIWAYVYRVCIYFGNNHKRQKLSTNTQNNVDLTLQTKGQILMLLVIYAYLVVLLWDFRRKKKIKWRHRQKKC